MRHLWILTLGLLALISSRTSLAAPASNAINLAPDLGMAKLSTVTLDTTTLPGHRLLRYTAVMVNIGAGRLEVRGTRPDTSSLARRLRWRDSTSLSENMERNWPPLVYCAGKCNPQLPFGDLHTAGPESQWQTGCPLLGRFQRRSSSPRAAILLT